MILAAGVGSRLDPLTRNLPKPMVPIINKPALVHIIELLVSHGIREVVINVHHLADQIVAGLGTGEQFGLRIFYSHEEQLLGTAGGVKKMREHFDETFLVIGGDDLAAIDLSGLVARHRERGSLASMALARVDDPSQFGVVMIDESGRIQRFLEKPSAADIFSNTVNTQVYVFEPEVLDRVPEGQVYDFGHHLFPQLLQEGVPFYGFPLSEEEYWCDVGDLEQYRQVHRDAFAGRVRLSLPVPQVAEDRWQGDGVEIAPTAKIGRHVVIGNRCCIEAGAQVDDYCVLGDDCVVGAGSVVRESILWRGAQVEENTFLERCVVGLNCRVRSNAGIFGGVVVDPRRP
jgi:mannose-1-phosphate guanylyltransferase/phosphomannomutase